MTTPVVFLAEAEADVRDARAWYAERDAKLGEEFVDEVERTMELIAEKPRMFPVVHRMLRRALLRRFPYCIFFDLKADVIEVLAVFHAHRDPQVWRSRV